MSKRILLIVTLWFFIFVIQASAHPGDTDSSGGHTCRTNCEDYGLEYGEYHYHNERETQSIQSYSSDYADGYYRGYDFAYSYTSQCEEDYEWWWEGPKEFGDGYEQGINDGHEAGLEVCYKNSYNSGYDQGYFDYINDIEYGAEPYDDYDYTSYEEGYIEGWDQGESEIEEEALSDESTEETIDSHDGVSSEESEEMAGLTVLIFVIFIFGLLWLLLKRRKRKKAVTIPEGEEKQINVVRSLFSLALIVLTAVFGYRVILNDDGSEPTDTPNPYSYTTVDHDCTDFETQEDAQLFYEANGGPEEDPHDLDRDNDGMACDWNP